MVNFAHIAITRNPDYFRNIIYRKPTNAEIMTLENACHIPENKHDSTRYFLNMLWFFH